VIEYRGKEMSEENFSVCLAADGFEDVLIEELNFRHIRILEQRGRLILVEPLRERRPAWAQNIWLNPQFIPIESIGDAAHKLASIQRNWHLTDLDNHRRATLISEKLPHVSSKPLHFGYLAPTAPLGSWTLWEPNLVLASSECTSAFPDGEVHFVEDKINPPSRAYLKLWELFTILPEAKPKAGDVCLDLGAAPGGWTYVLGSIGARVFAIDKAPLAENVRTMPSVESCIGSGFGLDPRHAGAVEWLFSDMICYPSRLYEGISRWIEYGECRRFVCTLKCQGKTDHETLARFAEFENARLIHLSCNKHELTFVLLPKEELSK